MSDTNDAGARRAPLHLWIVGVLAVLWNGLGAFDYAATQLRLEPYMEQFTDEQLDYFYGLPAWFDGCWAVAVWGGLLGSLLLLRRRRLASPLLLLSFLAMLATTVWSYGFTDGAELMGTAGAVFSAVIFVVALALVAYARKMARRGVLR